MFSQSTVHKFWDPRAATKAAPATLRIANEDDELWKALKEHFAPSDDERSVLVAIDLTLADFT